MLKAIFWKEWRQQSRIVCSIVIFMPVLAGVALWAIGPFVNERTSIWDAKTVEFARIVAICVALLQAIVTGSLLFASEVEDGTLPYLDACSAERGRIWRAKMLSGLAIAMPALVLPTLVGGFAGLLATIVAAEVVLMTAAVSVFVRTTFRAIGAAVLLLCVLTIVLAQLQTMSPGAVIGLNPLIVGVLMFASWHRFCRQDRERQTDVAPSSVVRLLQTPTWITASLWLLVRRQWLALVAAGVAFLAFVVCGAFLSHLQFRPLSEAPAFLFAIGCAFGWNVFALEQAGVEGFLGDQRFPRSRLWLAKVGVWLLLMFAATWAFDRDCDSGYRWNYDFRIPTFDRELLLGALGLAAGQFFGLHARRLPVAIFLTLFVATPMAAAWYAPLFGGEPAWHFVLVPILFLAATRLDLRRWTTGRLDGIASWIRCGLVVLVCFGWTALVLWHRVAVMPDVGEPFAVTESPTETPLERERNRRLAQPAEEASKRLYDSHLTQDDIHEPSRPSISQWHLSDIDLGSEPMTYMPTPCDRVFALGAPDEGRDEFAQRLTEAFKGDWSAALRRELVDGPRRMPVLEDRISSHAIRHRYSAARLFCLRSILSLAEGKPNAALDDFGAALALIRNCVLYGSSDMVGRLNWTDDETLEVAETLLRRGGDDPAFCRGLLDLLNRHAREMPSFSDAIKASYFAANSSDASETRRINGYFGPTAVLLESPVESIRYARLQRAFCRGLLSAAERKTLFLRPPMGYAMGWEPQVRYLALATPDRNADDWLGILSQQSLVWPLGDLFERFNRSCGHLAEANARLNAIRLACAAALYRHDRGRDPTSLKELAPEYFPALPESPYAECEFVFRRSAGEKWLFVARDYSDRHFDESTEMRRTIAPGTGVIEMPCLPKLKVAVPSIR